MSENDGIKIPGSGTITRNDVETYKREILDRVVMVRLPEVATALGCSRRSAYNLVRAGKLRGYSTSGEISKGIRVLASDLLEYVTAMRIDSSRWLE